VSVCLRVCVSVFVHILSCFDGGTTQICRCFGASASGTLMCWGGRKRYTKETEKGEEERRKPEHMMSQTKTQLTSLTHSTLCLPPPLLLSLSPPHSPLLSLLSLLSLSLSLSSLSLLSLSLSSLSFSLSLSLSLSLSRSLSSGRQAKGGEASGALLQVRGSHLGILPDLSAPRSAEWRRRRFS